MAAQAQVVQWNTSTVALNLNLALTSALNKLRAFCIANTGKYENFVWTVGVDLATGNFTVSASAIVYPDIYATLRDAEDQLGGLAKAYQAGNAQL